MIGVFPSWKGAADLEYQSKKRKTGRELFLERMEDLIRWDQLVEAIKPYYPQSAKGRVPYPLESMLRVHCVQLFYNLSDPATEDMLYEVESLRHFTGIGRNVATRCRRRAPSSTSVICWNVTDWPRCYARPSRSTWQSKD